MLAGLLLFLSARGIKVAMAGETTGKSERSRRRPALQKGATSKLRFFFFPDAGDFGRPVFSL